MQQLRQIIRPFNVRIDPVIAFMILAFIFIVAATVANAADKGGPKAQPSLMGDMQPTKTHAGCGIGGTLGWTNADLEAPGPINMGSNGARAGGRALCDWQYQAIVIGLFVDYDWQWGDLKTIGVEHELTVGGRGGVAVSQSAFVYGHASWMRADGSFGHADGLGYGIGTELRVPASPVALDFRWTHKTYDNVLGSGLDVNADEFKATLVFKLNLFK